jgi:hypothetical protein
MQSAWLGIMLPLAQQTTMVALITAATPIKRDLCWWVTVITLYREFVENIMGSTLQRMRRQLEILGNSEGGERGSLLWLLDQARTPFGSRRLRAWTAHPLRDAGAITARLDAVQELAFPPGAGFPVWARCPRLS